MVPEPEIIWISEQALTVRLGTSVSVEINQRVLALADSLQTAPLRGIFEWTASYCELLIEYCPSQTSFRRLSKAIARRLNRIDKIDENAHNSGRQLLLPVCYDDEFALDLESLAGYCAMEKAELVDRHIAGDYRVYMLGFSPGFCYLGGLDPRLFAPRLRTPRLRVPPGSIGIADQQTGIYSVESPGGWQIIGRCPLPLFLPDQVPHFPINAGDRVRFQRIDRNTFREIESVSQKENSWKIALERNPS